ncbi:MAG: PqqD family protein [Firmicutes bacterium]|nr:PqqD family protein [Candidatus Caballimonas caccae]
MKIKKGFILREIAGNYVVVAVGDRVKTFNGVINLNESGAFIWKQLENGTEKEKIIEEMLKEYNVSEEDAKKDVEIFIGKIKEAGLIE